MTDFIHLHVHSDYSLSDAAVSIMALVDRAEEMGMKHIALTDHGNMFGAMDFLAACKETIENYVDEEGEQKKRSRKRETPIKPIIGCEVYVAPASRFDKKSSKGEIRYHHLVLLAMNREGYLNLVKLCSFAYTEGFYDRPRIDDELLARYHGGLIALSACVSGEIPMLVQTGKNEAAEQKALYYRDLFGKDKDGNPNFYLEIQEHGIPAGKLKGPFSQREIYKAIINISKRTGIPLVATNDVHYLNRDDSEAHDTLVCIGSGKVRKDEMRKKYHGDQFYLKSGEEMAMLFPDYPEAIANTVRIAERCATDVPEITGKELPEFLPEFEIPPGFDNADAYLRHLVTEGLARRYIREKQENWEDIQKRAEYELDTIIQMGFTGYFLIVADFINWAKERNIPVGPGRGSGAGSIVAYTLHITNIDPLKYGLLFERFLNPERISMPDFDVDFAKEGRDDVIRYITEKYGQEQVGQILTFSTLGAKGVIKDVARVLGIPIAESDMITKRIPDVPKITLRKAIEEEPELLEFSQDPKYAELFPLAFKLEGLNRNSGIHASGVVIGKSALHNFVPLYKDPKTGAIATQYDMNHLEKRGLVKMDVLGLKTLDVIKNTEELIRERGGEYANFNVETVNEDDREVFKMLGKGQSFELFQFNSDGMQNTLRKAKPGRIEDLIALNALYRPGPMKNIPRFIDCKNGKQKINYPDPSLEALLKETYGVIVYQEQVLQVARIIAGFTLGHADELRRAMGKKIMEKMVEEKVKFISGAMELGHSEKRAEEIFELLIPFAGYGFNKSHSAGYAVLAYRTAYLKTNFPLEFMTASLTNEIHAADKEKLSACIAEARKMELAIDPPDINRSQKYFSHRDGRIIYGFLGIKGLGEAAADEIVNCRNDGFYRDFMDFLNRVDIRTVGKSVIQRLIKTGAFDQFNKTRETLLGNLENAVEYVQKTKDGKEFGQVSLFEGTGEKEYQDFVFEEFPALSRTEKLNNEKELIGFYFSGHPLDEYRELWQRMLRVDLGKPEALTPGGQILIGLVKNIKHVTTGKGDRIAYAVLEDYNGEIELAFFGEAWKKCQEHIKNDEVAILKGKLKYQADRERHIFTVDEYLKTDEAEKVLQEEEAQKRKWDRYKDIWKYAADLELRFLDPANQENKKEVTYTILGVLKSLRTSLDKNKKEMAFGTIESPDGKIDLKFFAWTWEKCKAVVAVDEVYALKGTVDSYGRKDQNRSSFSISSILDLNKLLQKAAKKAEENSKTAATAGTVADAVEDEYREIHIRLAEYAVNDDAVLYSLKTYLDGNPGTCPVYIHIPASSASGLFGSTMGAEQGKKTRETVIRTAGQISVTGSINALAKCAAVAEVWGAT
ncbi:MAG: DNA polymerase III subunit alpha [Treponema sp.]|jgi:DNA polymerase-3 subunit alpha|nr:DNA polymerase III subunit alpha [Treponema sp.]